MPNTTGADQPKHHALFVVWHRSRTRALAHHFASIRLQEDAHKTFRSEMRINIIGLLLLVSGLSFSDGGLARTVTEILSLEHKSAAIYTTHALEILGILLITISALTSIYGLYLNIISDRFEKTVLHARHKLISRQFMSISQKTRRPDSGLFDDSYCNNLVFQLNDQLETILTSAENPEDQDYKKANKIIQDVFSSNVVGVSDSFIPESSEIDVDIFKVTNVIDSSESGINQFEHDNPQTGWQKIKNQVKIILGLKS